MRGEGRPVRGELSDRRVGTRSDRVQVVLLLYIGSFVFTKKTPGAGVFSFDVKQYLRKVSPGRNLGPFLGHIADNRKLIRAAAIGLDAHKDRQTDEYEADHPRKHAEKHTKR